MKTIFLRVLLLCMGIVFFACNDDDKEDLPEPAELQVSPSKLEFLGNGGRDSVMILTLLDTWDAESSETWCKITPSGNLLLIDVEAVTMPTERAAVITVTSGEEKKEIPVFQKGASTLTAELDTVRLDVKGTAVDVRITASSTDWTFSTELTWCHLSKNGEYLVVAADPNESADPNVGEIFLTLNEKKVRLIVEQAGETANEDKVGGVYVNESGDVVGIIIAITETDKYVVSLEEENNMPFAFFFNDIIDTREYEKDGKAALEKVKQENNWESNYTWAATCKNMETSTKVTGWYIPGSGEDVVWNALADNFDVLNEALTANGGDSLRKGNSSDKYCTSTMCIENSYAAIYRIFLNDITDKYTAGGMDYLYIRPVLHITQ